MQANAAPMYRCLHRECDGFPTPDNPVWADLPVMRLSDTQTGADTGPATTVAAFWHGQALYFCFTCHDSEIVANMLNHDDPIYEEDVVEVFISETGDLCSYKELEVSPKNVRFDAQITNDLQGHVSVGLDWDAVGWRTAVYGDVTLGQLYYVWELPFVNFSTGTPQRGDRWRFNCYRIDRGIATDQYLAWSPTGILDFHVPQKFGWLCFV